jgi:hypothetical protein
MAGDNGNSGPTPAQTPANIALTRPGPNGGLLRTGNPGNKGGGRPTNAFREAMAKAAAEIVLPKAVQVVTDRQPDKDGEPDASWWRAADAVLKYGQPEAPKEVNQKVSGTVVLRAERE